MDDPWLRTLPFWDKLTSSAQTILLEHIETKHFQRGVCFYHGSTESSGPMLVRSGQIRAFINAPHGGEITLYRLGPGEICILQSSCVVQKLHLGVHLEIEKDAETYILPVHLYDKLMAESLGMRNFITDMMAIRFENVMWVLNQMAFSNTGQRLAQTLLERGRMEGSDTLVVTHEDIARDLGIAREMVSRLLGRFQQDGLVALSRGNIRLLDKKRLQEL